MIMGPRITIITPSYQQRQYLEECLLSVRDQEYANVEHIVVDGGSTDGSKDLLERYSDKLAWWCSEHDHGQSDAINKGLARCTGEVFAWLNSDDVLLPGALHAVARAFEQAPRTIILEGARSTLTADGKRERMPQNDPADPDAMFIAPHVNQQATFFNAAAVKSVGGVDTALHFAMDLDLWWRVLFANGTKGFASIPEELALFRLQPSSKTMQGSEDFVRETAALLCAMATSAELHDLAAMLRTGYGEALAVRPSNARKDHADIVERMVLRFVLKWNATIADVDRFNMLKQVQALYGAEIRVTDEVLKERWERLRKGLVAPDWNTYRIGRKLGLWPA